MSDQFDVKKLNLKALEGINALREHDHGTFLKHLTGFGKADERLDRLQKEIKESTPVRGKYIFLLRGEWEDGLRNGGVAKSTSFVAYHKNQCGVGPNNHAESCANTWAVAVALGHMTEQDYDCNSTEALERASRIFSKANDVKGTHPASVAAIALLKLRPAKILKMLKDISDRISNEKVATVDETGAETVVETIVLLDNDAAAAKADHIDPLKAAEMIDHILRTGNLSAIIGGLMAHAKTTESETDAEQLVSLSMELCPALTENVITAKAEDGTLETAQRWSDEFIEEAANRHVNRNQVQLKTKDDETAADALRGFVARQGV